MAKIQRLVGIDFGTSTSVIRVKRYQDGEPIGDSFSSGSVTFGNGEGDTKAATIVRKNPDGSFTCGAEAEEAVPESKVFREFKMRLEDPDPAEQAESRALTEAYFRYLFERYDHQRSDLGELDDEERTFVSLPVKWRAETRRFMAQAAEKAGFKNVSIMDEPTAALYATLCRKMSEINQQGLLRTGEPGYLLLVDMGAGTTDLALCRYTVDGKPGEIIRADRIQNEIIATWPEDRSAATFGGREVDRVLEDYVEAYLTGCGLPESMAGQFVRGNSNSAAKRWKETAVSKNLNEGKRVETCGFIANVIMLLPQQKPFPAFGRAEFEEMLGDSLEQFKGLAAGCLQKASAAEPEVLAKGIDLVILTGGHSAWYFTEELLNGTMPGLALPQLERVQREKSRVIRLTNPQETVALGLVYSALPFQVGKEKEPESQAQPEPQPESQLEPVPGYPISPKSNQITVNDYLKAVGVAVLLPGVGQIVAAGMLGKKLLGNGKPGTAQAEQEALDQALLQLGIWAEAFFRHYDQDFIRKLQRLSKLEAFCRNLKIPVGESLYLAHDDTLLASGKNGFALCSRGIYCKRLDEDPQFTDWLTFLTGQIQSEPAASLQLTDQSEAAHTISYYSGSTDGVTYKDVHAFFCQLQAYLNDRFEQQKQST